MLKQLKIGFFFLFFCSFAFATPYVLENQHQLVDKTTGFIEILSSEVYEKTGISLYVIALKELDNKSIQEWQQQYVKKMKTPFVLLFFTRSEKKIDIITSADMSQIFDKKGVYWSYIVPLIPNSDKELTPQNISAFLLNGFVEIADRIAAFYGVTLEHTFPKQNKGLQIATRTILYLMMFSLLLVFVYVSLRRKS